MRWNQPATYLPAAVITLIAAMLCFALWRDRPPRVLPIETLTSFQDAAAPLLLPADGKPRHRLHRFGGWELGQIPAALRFDSPLGSERGALSHPEIPFGSRDDARGGLHLGHDLSGIGGANADLGDPVFSVADGLVVYAGQPSPEWGNVVILAHRDRHGRSLQSCYGHLGRIDVAVGSLIPRGKRLGILGTAAGRFPAHLHFEIRLGDGVDIGSGWSATVLNRLDASSTVASLTGDVADDLAPPPLRAALIPREEPWTTLEIKGAEHLGELLGR
jgi:murein DD-endopeptidase MepM/ murein hydrolase activator NlpD